MKCNRFTPVFNRRDLLRTSANGFGMLALSAMLEEEARAATIKAPAAHPAVPPTPLAARPPMFPARAKRVIFLFMHGGPSHVDTFDPKPALTRDNGKPYPGEKPRVQFAQTGNLLKSPWEFRHYGQSGTEVSDLFPHVGGCVDDMCVIRSIYANNAAHGGALLQLHTGSDTFVRPSIGSWVTYGLGTENQNLPGFITICPTLGHGGVQNWSSAFLPADYQGTPIGNASIRAKEASIKFIRNPETTPDLEQLQLAMLKQVNERHLAPLGPDQQLEGRINSFELAYRMQAAAPEMMDISGESAETLKLYGINEDPTDNFGRQCLLARRFAEREVRYIQCTHSYKWDQHSDLRAGHSRNAKEVDQPIAALLQDLKAHGLLEDTLVWWGGEFGRTPTAQGSDGRDHNPHAFSMWLAGGGVKGGTTYGATDDWGYYSVQDKVHMRDLHATILNLLGMDHLKLTYRYAGRDFRLTDVAGEVVKGIISG